MPTRNDPSPSGRLRSLLAEPGLLLVPSCFDALSAKLIERAGFRLAFMSGFAVSAARLGLPDTGLISFGELLDQGRNLCAAVKIPVIGDGDTGFGNAVNVKRTVEGYARAGFAAVMIEDQVAPKRCGHTAGKAVVPRAEALTRIRAAVDAREEGADILILARTDARGPLGFDEALERCRAFADLGADHPLPRSAAVRARDGAVLFRAPATGDGEHGGAGAHAGAPTGAARGARVQDRGLSAHPARGGDSRHAAGARRAA